MPPDDQDPLEDAPDPTADTPDSEAEDSTEADDQAGSDPEARYAEAQATITRQAQELALYRGKVQADEPLEEPAAAQGDDFLARATQDSWALAESLYGTESVDAYRVAYQLYEAAATPADFMAAFEAYHEIRSGRAAAPAAKGSAKPSRSAATTPRVDDNRSEPGPDLAKADAKLAEARKGTSLGSFAAAAAARMGFGPGS